MVKNGRLLDTRSDVMATPWRWSETGKPGCTRSWPGPREIALRPPQVLIADSELLFQGVQLGIAEELPPVAANSLVAGLRGLPPIRLP